MTREKFIEELNFNCKVDGKEVWLNIMPCIEKLLDEHEAQLKAKDEEIIKLYNKFGEANEESVYAGYNIGIKKARSIVAMLRKEWRKAEREYKEEGIPNSDAWISYIDARQYSYEKAYAMLKDKQC